MTIHTKNKDIDKNKSMVTLKAIGDIAFFRSIALKARDYGDNFIFDKVRDYLNNDDLLFGNFEFPFSNDANPHFLHSYHGYRANLSVLPALSKVNFDILNLANNHIMDWGLEGMMTTKNALESLGIKTIGVGINLKEARKPVVIEKKGVKFGFLGYVKAGDWTVTDTTSGTAKIDINLIREDINYLKRKVDHIIVSLHWGTEFSDYPYPGDVKMAHKIIDIGARIILGHHPHVLQGYEKYGNGLIFYSLGNFVYDPYSERVFVKASINERLESIIAEIKFSKDDIVSFTIMPIKINNRLQPVILSCNEKERLLKRIQFLSEDIANRKLEFYQHALSNLLERELKTYRLLLRENGLRFLISRLKFFKFRHIKLLINFLLLKLRILM